MTRSLSAALVALVSIAMLLVACDPSTTTQPSPTAAPSATTSSEASPTPAVPTPSPSPTPSPPSPRQDAQAALSTALDTWNAILEAPVATEAPAEVVAAVDSTTGDDSQARSFFDDQLLFSFDEESAVRGDVMGVPVGKPELTDDNLEMSACLSRLATIQAEGDQAGETFDNGTYQLFDLAATRFNDDWILNQFNFRSANDADVDERCVPPEIETGLLDRTEGWIDAFTKLAADPENSELLKDARAFWSDQQMPDFGSGRGIFTDILVDSRVEIATRNDAVTSWCIDPSRNPEAGFIAEDGTETPYEPNAELARWVRQTGSWVLKSIETGGPSTPDRNVDRAYERCVDNA